MLKLFELPNLNGLKQFFKWFELNYVWVQFLQCTQNPILCDWVKSRKYARGKKRETEGEKRDTKRGGGFPGRHVVLWYGVRVLLDRREVLVSSLPRRSSFPSGHTLHQRSLDPSFQKNPPSSPSLSLLLLPLVPLLLLLVPRPCGCSATSLSELIRVREKREKAPPRGLMHFSLHFLLFSSYRKNLLV